MTRAHTIFWASILTAALFGPASAGNSSGRFITPDSVKTADIKDSEVSPADVRSGSTFTFGGIVSSGTISSDGPIVARSTLTVEGNALSVGGSTLVVSGGMVGVGTSNPAATLDANGSAQFGSGATKSTFSTTAELSMASGKAIHLAGSGGNLSLTNGGQIIARSTVSIGGQNASQNTALLHIGGCTDIPLSGPSNTAIFACRDANDGGNTTITARDPNNNTEISIVAGVTIGVRGQSNTDMAFNTNNGGAVPSFFDMTTNGQFGFRRGAFPANVNIGSSTLMSMGNADIPFTVGPSTLVVRGSGFVGVGTPEPGTKLHMSSGTLLVDGTGAAVNTTGSYQVKSLVAFSSAPVFALDGHNSNSALASGTTIQAHVYDSAATLMRIAITIVTAGVGGTGDTIRCNAPDGTGIEVTSAAAAAAGTTTKATGVASIPVNTEVFCHLESGAATKPQFNFALGYQMQ